MSLPRPSQIALARAASVRNGMRAAAAALVASVALTGVVAVQGATTSDEGGRDARFHSWIVLPAESSDRAKEMTNDPLNQPALQRGLSTF